MSELDGTQASATEQAGRHAVGVGQAASYIPVEGRRPREIPRAVRRYLNPAETSFNVLVMRQHPAALAWPCTVLLGGLALASILNWLAWDHHQASPLYIHTLWIGWVIIAGWYQVKAAGWYATWIVVTPVRMMKVSGLVRRSINPLPMKRARDVELYKTLAGRMLGYGTLRIQSFGTGHQLSEIPYVPYPDDTFNSIWQILLPEREAAAMPGSDEPW